MPNDPLLDLLERLDGCRCSAEMLRRGLPCSVCIERLENWFFLEGALRAALSALDLAAKSCHTLEEGGAPPPEDYDEWKKRADTLARLRNELRREEPGT